MYAVTESCTNISETESFLTLRTKQDKAVFQIDNFLFYKNRKSCPNIEAISLLVVWVNTFSWKISVKCRSEVGANCVAYLLRHPYLNNTVIVYQPNRVPKQKKCWRCEVWGFHGCEAVGRLYSWFWPLVASVIVTSETGDRMFLRYFVNDVQKRNTPSELRKLQSKKY